METVVTPDRADAFVGLVESRLVPAYRLARAILLDDVEAEDAVQDACLAAWRSRASLRDPDRFGAWFDRILVNGCRDRLRTRERQRVRAIALEREAHARIGQSPGDRELVDALAGLDADHRIVVLLRFEHDLTLEEIARRLDVPPGTVKSRLHYALRTIRTRLEATDGRA
jgi:RNA polymerase sigma-70 factor (ECF subfamily)